MSVHVVKDAISRPCPHFDQEKHKEDGEASYNGLRMTSSPNYNAGNITKAGFPCKGVVGLCEIF